MRVEQAVYGQVSERGHGLRDSSDKSRLAAEIYGRLDLPDGVPGGVHVVPGVVKAPQRRRRLQPVQKCVQLGVVGVVFRLRVDLPGEGAPRPQRTHQRIFAPHEVPVARPQQLVVAGLRQVRKV